MELVKGRSMNRIPRLALGLCYGLAGVLVLISAAGLWLPEIYAKEKPSWAAQGMGQDAVDLFFVAPFLAFCAYQVGRWKRVFLFFLEGILGYLVYSFVLYAFCVHFNRIFFLYCAGLGLSVYALALLNLGVGPAEAGKWFDTRPSTKLPGLFFLAVTLIFYLLWLSEDIPAVLSGTGPKSLEEVGLFTNPVHILDLSLVLPAMLIASIQLLRHQTFGYWFFPVMMSFSIVMAVAIGGMVVALKAKGITADLTVAYVFAGMILADSFVLGFFLRSLRESR